MSDLRKPLKERSTRDLSDHLSSGWAAKRGAEIRTKALELARSGDGYKTIADKLGIAVDTLQALRLMDDNFERMLERAMFQASPLILDELKEVPNTERDAAMARVRIEALRTYLELRWPERYGKRLDVTVRTLDMRGALESARKRAGITIDSQAESITYGETSSDSQSVDPAILAALLE